MIRRISILGILGGLLLAACERFPVGDAFDINLKERQELSDKRKLRRMRVDIFKMAGEAECEHVEDCRFFELGAKPCGGPWEYLLYSVAQMDSVVLAKHVAKHNRFESQMNARYGYASDCARPPEPQLACVAGRCLDLNRTDASKPNDGSQEKLAPEPLGQLHIVDPSDVLPESDPYRLHEAEIDGDVLLATVSFGGGCEAHEPFNYVF